MKHKTQTKRLLSLMLALCMVISMFSGLTLMASAADETWTPVELASVQPTDVIVIVATLSNGTTYAMPYDNGTSKPPAATAITVTDGKLTSVADNLKWNVTKAGENYKFNPANDASTFLYCTSTNNGVRVGTNANNQFTLDAATGYLKNVATSRYIGVYNAQDWRCYTNTTGNTANQTFTFYKLGSGEPAPDTYAITTEVTGKYAELGDISIPASAAANEPVTITSTSKKIVDVLVATASGTTIETVPVDDHNVSFTMPAEAVDVIVQLEDYYDVVLNVTGGTDADVVVDPATAPVGARVTVSATASKIIESVTCDPVCDVIEVDGTYCFDMPGEDVIVSVALADKPATTYTKVSKPENGDTVAIILDQNEANNNLAITTTASGKGLAGVTLTPEGDTVKTAENVAFTVSVDENGYYSFVADGKYLTSGNTGSPLSLADAASDYSLWTLEAAEGGWFIKSVNAAYNGNAQYLEFYSVFTVYGKSATANAAIYTFNFYKDYGDEPIPEKYAITTKVTGNKSAPSDISIDTEATAGDVVAFTSAGKKIESAYALGETTATEIPVEITSDGLEGMFVMPAEPVSLEIKVENYYDVLLSVTGGEEADVTVDHTVAPAGEMITVSANEGKTIETVECLPTCEVIEDNGAYCFEMPTEDVLVSVTLKTAPVFAIDTKTSVGEGGIVVAEPAEATEGTQVTLTAMVEDGYELATWGYSYLGTEDVVTVELPTGSLTVTFTMPGEDVEVYATFKEKVVVYHDVLLYGYQHESSLTVEDGLTLEGRLPELTAPEGYSFVGWTEAVEDNADGSCPTMYNETTPVTGDLMLNAVYSKAGEGGGSGDYVKVTENLADWSGEYLIVYEATDQDAGVLDSTLDATGLSAVNNNVSALIVDGNTISANSHDEYAVTIEKVTGGYSIQTKSNLYIGHTGSKNSLNTDAKPFVNEISYDATEKCAVIGQPNTKYVLRYNAASNVKAFRFYTGSQQPIQLYKKESGSLTYTLNPVAGVVEEFTKDPTVVLNYDRNVKLELDMLVDTAKLGGHTVKDIQTDLMDMNAGWYNKEEVGNGTIVTSNKDGILIENPDPNLSLVGNFQVTLDDNSTGTGIITIMGAQKVYCEDDNNMFDFTDGKNGTWDIDFSGDEVQFQDVKDTFDDRDSHYVNCATYSGNFAHVATVGATEVKPSAANTWPTATFTFRGTGFELISAANAFGGAGKIELKKAESGELISAHIFNNYYGGKYNGETGEWEKTGGDNNAVNQAPIAAAEKLPYGDYQVTVTAIYSPAFDYAELGEYQLVIDGARVIDPLDEAGEGSCAYEEYKIHDLISEAENLDQINLYVDGKGEISVLDALQFGPANEIYLAPGQAIPMQFIAGEIPTISIGARAYTGAPTTLGVYKAADGAITAPILTEQIATATDMHYALENIFTLNETAGYFETGTIVVRNDGAEPLALSSVRYESGFDVGAWVDNESYATAASFVKRMVQNKQNFASLTDVDANAWYFGSVKFAVESGIMAGVGDNRFAPKQELTRAMAVRVLYVLAGQPEAKANTTFTDVAANTWYADAVAWGAENGIVAGVSATKFNPNGKLTREQMVAFLYRYAGKAQVADDSIANYTDGAQVSAYAVNAMNWAIANGIVSGMGNGTLAPKATANRAQMASILAHCDELYAN